MASAPLASPPWIFFSASPSASSIIMPPSQARPLENSPRARLRWSGRPRGGIGRRAGFKILCPYGRIGSTPIGAIASNLRDHAAEIIQTQLDPDSRLFHPFKLQRQISIVAGVLEQLELRRQIERAMPGDRA